LLFRAETLHYIEQMLRKLDPFGHLRIGQAMGNPPRGAEMKPAVV
jgi:hypothetical protein